MSRTMRQRAPVDYKCTIGNDILIDSYATDKAKATNTLTSVSAATAAAALTNNNNSTNTATFAAKAKSRKSIEFDKENAHTDLNSSIEHIPKKQPSSTVVNKAIKRKPENDSNNHNTVKSIPAPVLTVPVSSLSSTTLPSATAGVKKNKPSAPTPAPAPFSVPSTVSTPAMNDFIYTRPTHQSQSLIPVYTNNRNPVTTVSASVSAPAPVITSIVRDLQSNNYFNGLLADKDSAYAELLSKYNTLRNERKQATDSLLNNLTDQTSSHMKAAEELSTHYKLQYESLVKSTQENTKKSNEFIQSLELQLESLKSNIDYNNSIIAAYRCLTGTTVKINNIQSQPDIIQFTTINRSSSSNNNNNRKIKFELNFNSTGDNIIYSSKSIELNDLQSQYPEWLNENSIEFDPSEAPNLLKNIINWVFKQ